MSANSTLKHRHTRVHTHMHSVLAKQNTSAGYNQPMGHQGATCDLHSLWPKEGGHRGPPEMTD